jgi:small conductance mechanosensitive channel
MIDITSLQTKALELTMQYLPKVLLALITLIVGLQIIKHIINALDKISKARKIDISLRRFLKSFLSIILKVLLFISIASMIGIATTSFIAVLAAAGFAIGLALQGSLANFAGGVLILLFKPFEVGDVINAQGFTGTIERIEIFNTIMKKADNTTIIIPNGKLSNDAITNYSKEELRRVDMVFGIGYDDDIKKAEEVFTDMLKKDKRVLKEPAPVVNIAELADSSVNFNVRPWVKKEDYWSLYFDMNREVKLRLDKEGISIPYPQTDVHLHQK